MKLIKPTKIDHAIFCVSIVFIGFTLMYIMYGSRVWTDWKIWAVNYFIIIIIGYFSLRIHVAYNYYIESKFPTLEKTFFRIVYKLLANIFIMSPSIFLLIYLFHSFRILGYQIEQNDLLYSYFTGLLSNLVIGSILECVYSIGKYKEMIAYTESLKKQQLQLQFDNLKSQVNPHFLFNTLSSLSALIWEDEDKADTFLNEMSKVYRYMLNANEHSSVTLQQELGFIKSYYYLLNIRYNTAIQLSVNTNQKSNNYSISPLTLQFLIDNAVRFNIASKESPLVIKIESKGEDCILIKNNLQLKTLTILPTGNSMDIVNAKYNSSEFRIEQTSDEFVVTIPLKTSIKKLTEENG